MPQFDVHRNPAEPGCLLDCQSDLLSNLSTRFVVPLLPRDYAPLPSHRLNPTLRVLDEELVMMVHFAVTVPRRALGKVVASLSRDYTTIMNALDVLLTGY